jgi:hypothetical protein
VSACLADFEYVADEGGGGGGGADSSTVASGGGNAGGASSSSSGAAGTGGDADALVDRGLVARYYLDEAASGQAPPLALDAAPDPLDLPIIYSADMSYSESSGHRGLMWTQAQTDGRAAIDAAGTKIEAALTGSMTATFEVVVAIDNLPSSVPSARLASLSNTLASVGDFDVVGRTGEISIGWNEGLAGMVSVPSGRSVLHVVVDTAAAMAVARRLVYVDGVPVSGGSLTPAVNEVIESLEDAGFALGNRIDGGRSAAATLFYAALYSTAFTGAEVEHNVAILSLDDDRP